MLEFNKDLAYGSCKVSELETFFDSKECTSKDTVWHQAHDSYTCGFATDEFSKLQTFDTYKQKCFKLSRLDVEDSLYAQMTISGDIYEPKSPSSSDGVKAMLTYDPFGIH